MRWPEGDKTGDGAPPWQPTVLPETRRDQESKVLISDNHGVCDQHVFYSPLISFHFCTTSRTPSISKGRYDLICHNGAERRLSWAEQHESHCWSLLPKPFLTASPPDLSICRAGMLKSFVAEEERKRKQWQWQNIKRKICKSNHVLRRSVTQSLQAAKPQRTMRTSGHPHLQSPRCLSCSQKLRLP